MAPHRTLFWGEMYICVTDGKQQAMIANGSRAPTGCSFTRVDDDDEDEDNDRVKHTVCVLKI